VTLPAERYPDGLRGDDIPLLAQLVGIVDTYDAITTTRPYRAALPAEHAYDELTRETALGLRREDLVQEFIALGRAGRLEEIAAAVQPRVASVTSLS
jgi:HD-GYP domain-containing protein (c-di-GMP phosphodiesterase class II)